jgi:hypothetical protein
MNRNAHRKALAHKRAPEPLEPLSEEDRALAASFALPSEDELQLARRAAQRGQGRALSPAQRPRRAGVAGADGLAGWLVSTPAIPLPVLVDALAALRAIKDAPGTTVPTHLWTPAMRAHNRLETHLILAGLTIAVAVEPTQVHP